MTEKQQKWTQSRCYELKQYLEQNFPLSQAQWDSVIAYIDEIVKLSKGNEKVRSALFDTVEPYDRKTMETSMITSLSGER